MSDQRSNAAALAIVVVINWIIAHLAPSWAMPSEVQSSLQALIIFGVALWLKEMKKETPNA